MLESETMDVPQERLHYQDSASGQAAKMLVLLLLKEMLNRYCYSCLCFVYYEWAGLLGITSVRQKKACLNMKLSFYVSLLLT